MVERLLENEQEGAVPVGADRPAALLEFRFAHLACERKESEPLDGINLTLRSGECLLMWTSRPAVGSMVADAASGLIPPSEGSVVFEGVDWRHRSARAAAKVRGRIGRVFGDSGWVSNLDVRENLLLRAAHHSRLYGQVRRRELAAVTDRLHVGPVPDGRPAHVSADRLQQMQWVRAFLGSPSLVVLEFPGLGEHPDRLEPFATEVRRVTARGGAVLWITASETEWGCPMLGVHQRYRIDGRRCTAVGKES